MEDHKPHSELRKRVERILGESGYMGYEGDIAEFWESVRDHGWGSVEDEAKSLVEDMRGVLIDLIEQLEALRELEAALREIEKEAELRRERHIAAIARRALGGGK